MFGAVAESPLPRTDPDASVPLARDGKERDRSDVRPSRVDPFQLGPPNLDGDDVTFANSDSDGHVPREVVRVGRGEVRDREERAPDRVVRVRD